MRDRDFAIGFAIILVLSVIGFVFLAEAPEVLESSDITYSTMDRIAQQSDIPGQSEAARRALSDGFLSEDEYDDIILMRDESADEAAKREAIQRWKK